MKKTWKLFAVLLVGFAISLCTTKEVHAEGEYTYNYDYWGEVQESPDSYEVVDVFTSVQMGLDLKLKAPEGLFVRDDKIYICDTGNNRIIELTRKDKDHVELVRIIDQFQGLDGNNTFNAPTDIAVSEKGELYIADRDNGRIVKLSNDLTYQMDFTKPKDSTFDQSLTFLPSKIGVDSAGRVYCVATNVNKGLIKYEKSGKFAGFVGATKVSYNWADYLWKRVATRKQRSAMESFVPTEYDNCYMDYEGFIYVCTSNLDSINMNADDADPVRRLNMLGSDIMIRNGSSPVIGDLYWGIGGGYKGPSMFCDVTAMENDVFVVLDKMRGRLFTYDDQGRLLYVFGGNGNMDGYFKQPTAIEHQGHDLIVLDALDSSITVFTPTTFGKTIFDAIEQFQAGEYEKSGQSWNRVMEINGNYDLAYIGMGRSLLRQKKYHEAMKYFSRKLDDENYSKAFIEYRKEWVQDHIVQIIVIVLVLLCVPLIVHRLKSVKHEIDTSDIFRE